MTAVAVDYIPMAKIDVFLGNEDAEPDFHGNVWWAICKDLDVLGDGDTPSAAIQSCREGAMLKLRILRDKGIGP